MSYLPRLFRVTLYHLSRLFRQGGRTVAIFAAVGFNMFGHGTNMSLVEHLERLPKFMASILVSAVIFHIGLKHFNEYLERLVKEGQDTEAETRRTINLLGLLLRRHRREAVKSDDLDSKNSADDNNPKVK
jgi:hypothetical protein